MQLLQFVHLFTKILKQHCRNILSVRKEIAYRPAKKFESFVLLNGLLQHVYTSFAMTAYLKINFSVSKRNGFN